MAAPSTKDPLARELFIEAKKKGYKLDALSFLTGYSAALISDFRHDKRRLSLEAAHKIADSIGMELVLVPKDKTPE